MLSTDEIKEKLNHKSIIIDAFEFEGIPDFEIHCLIKAV